jgi:hypothetical protein
MFVFDLTLFILKNVLNIDPHSISENVALEETPFTLFTASPLRGVPQFKRWAAKTACRQAEKK